MKLFKKKSNKKPKSLFSCKNCKTKNLTEKQANKHALKCGKNKKKKKQSDANKISKEENTYLTLETPTTTPQPSAPPILSSKVIEENFYDIPNKFVPEEIKSFGNLVLDNGMFIQAVECDQCANCKCKEQYLYCEI